MQQKGLSKNGELYKFIKEGQEWLKRALNTKNPAEEISELLENMGLEEIYDDRFYNDRSSVYMLIETLIATYINWKGQATFELAKNKRYKKANTELEKKVKKLERELNIYKEKEEMKEVDL